MKKKTKDMMILGSSMAVSMMAGFAIGCIKTKLMNNDLKCIIDEM